jgi:hypothetical protein
VEYDERSGRPKCHRADENVEKVVGGSGAFRYLYQSYGCATKFRQTVKEA